MSYVYYTCIFFSCSPLFSLMPVKSLSFSEYSSLKSNDFPKVQRPYKMDEGKELKRNEIILRGGFELAPFHTHSFTLSLSRSLFKFLSLRHVYTVLVIFLEFVSKFLVRCLIHTFNVHPFVLAFPFSLS